jgi:hypothetical protein
MFGERLFRVPSLARLIGPGGTMKLACMIGLVAVAVAMAVVGPGMGGAEERRFRFDDFEDGDARVRGGLSWIALSGEMLGGGARARVSVVAPGAARSRHALRLEATMAEPGPHFAGAWAALDPRGRPVDLSGFAGVRMRLRGPASVQIALRAGAGRGVTNFAAEVAATAEWTAVDIPFGQLSPSGPGTEGRWDPTSVWWLGVGIAPRSAPGAHSVEIDDVELYGSGPGPAAPVASEGPAVAGRWPVERAALDGGAEWRALGSDPAGDGKQATLPDAVALRTRDGGDGLVWFRIDLAAPAPESSFGANLVLDVDGDPANGMAWWGTNKTFHFDRLVTAWLFPAGDAFEGVAGIADAEAVGKGTMMGGGEIRVDLAPDRRSIALGVPRSALGSGARVRVVAAAGSGFAHNDDLPNDGAVELPGRPAS